MGRMAYIPKACGFVLVRDDGAAGIEYLLLTNRKHGAPGVPKGHVKEGESELETALRETREETGLRLLMADPWFRTVMSYPVVRKGTPWHKTVVLRIARTGHETVRLSEEHRLYQWLSLGDMLAQIPFDNLRAAVRDAALYLKDPALLDLEPATEQDADAHVSSLSDATRELLGHLRGGARLARTFAEALAEAGKRVHVEATATAAMLHDVGRALGRHDDHPIAGIEHLRGHRLEPYRFACVSHFTKGAVGVELKAAGVPPAQVDAMRRAIDLNTLTWEEHAIALADACMRGSTPVRPALRFQDLRSRYTSHDMIALQERRTEGIRRTLEVALGTDPLSLVELAS